VNHGRLRIDEEREGENDESIKYIKSVSVSNSENPNRDAVLSDSI
jgi:hypothetical protein